MGFDLECPLVRDASYLTHRVYAQWFASVAYYLTFFRHSIVRSTACYRGVLRVHPSDCQMKRLSESIGVESGGPALAFWSLAIGLDKLRLVSNQPAVHLEALRD